MAYDIIEDAITAKEFLIAREGSIIPTPTQDLHIANKKYVDDSLEPLTDDSMADTLHRHSELSASDGSPNPALSVDALGNVGIGTTSPSNKLNIIGAGQPLLLESEADGEVSIEYKNTAPMIWRAGMKYNENYFIRDQTNSKNIFEIEPGADEYSLYIDSSSKVGIGTTSPSEKLDVVGNAEINGNIIVTGTVDGIDIATDVAANTSKVSYTKTNVKGHIAHGATAGTTRPTGFTSVEWVGSVEPTNAENGDTWIDTS